MSDAVDTSAEAVGRIVLKLVEPPSHWHERHAAEIIRALLRERDEARADRDHWKDAARAALQARLDEDMNARARPDVAAILRGEAVAVPVELPEEMFVHLEPGAHSRVADAWANALAASPYALKET